MFQATPKLSEDKVRQCVDTRLGGEYPPKAVAKVFTLFRIFSPSFLFYLAILYVWKCSVAYILFEYNISSLDHVILIFCLNSTYYARDRGLIS